MRAPAAISLMLLCTGIARGQAAPDTRALIAQLGSESWLERDLATTELGQTSRGVTLEDLEVFIAAPDLDPEQRARLLKACAQRFSAQPRGALGVQFGTVGVGSIEVQPIEANAEFPASTMLNPGDRITMVDARIVEGSLEFRAQILSRRPGDILPVTILRRDAQSGEDRLIELDLPLGSFEALTGAAPMDPTLVRRALALRWDRAGISPERPGAVGAGIDIDAWSRAAFPEGAAPDPRTPDRRTPSVVVVGAGLPVQTGYGSAPPPITPWTGPGQLAADAALVEGRLRDRQLELLEARRLLLDQQRQQLLEDQRDAPAEETPLRREQADELARRLEALGARIEALRTPPSPGDERP